jgi:hypothetical protein
MALAARKGDWPGAITEMANEIRNR